jgi:hypothetical protein
MPLKNIWLRRESLLIGLMFKALERHLLLHLTLQKQEEGRIGEYKSFCWLNKTNIMALVFLIIVGVVVLDVMLNDSKILKGIKDVFKN